MKLPHGERAVVPVEKLTEYCLNPDNRVGQHKARVFASVLGITAAQAELLRTALLIAARDGAAIPGRADQHGQRYVIDFPMRGPDGEGIVRSAWIISAGDEVPRLITCYVYIR